jgi:hypothetical protein
MTVACVLFGLSIVLGFTSYLTRPGRSVRDQRRKR